MKRALFLGTLDLVGQILSKNGVALTDSTTYSVLNSMAILWTAVFSRALLKNKFNNGQYAGIVVLLLGSVLYAYGKKGQKGADDVDSKVWMMGCGMVLL